MGDDGHKLSKRWAMAAAASYTLLPGVISLLLIWCEQGLFPESPRLQCIVSLLAGVLIASLATYFMVSLGRPGLVSLLSLVAIGGIFLSWGAPFVEAGHSDVRFLVMSGGMLMVLLVAFLAGAVKWGRSASRLKLW